MTSTHQPSHRRPVSPRVRRNRTIAFGILAAALAILLVVLVVNIARGANPAPVAATATPTATQTVAPTPTPTPTPTATPTPTETVPPAPPAFDKAAFSIDDPLSAWVVVNKTRPLNPVDYTPPDLVSVPVAHTWDPLLRAEAAAAIVQMFDAASAEAGLSLASNSAYRSYSSQVAVYNSEPDDSTTARPGYSEHQTGWTMDIGAESGNCSLNTCFGDTAEGQWLAANAYRFGFLLRYPADKVEVTGFSFEPWHYRYIGVPLATEMHNTGVTTLEEFFGLPAAPGYLN